MKPLTASSTGHIVVDFDGKRMLVDTGADRSYDDEYQGVRVDNLSHFVGMPLDGVIGMDNLHGRVLSLSSRSNPFKQYPSGHDDAPLTYIAGIPCVDIRINEIPCRAAIKTGLTTTYLSETLLSRDKHSRVVDDFHPVYGAFKVNMYVNYFRISNKNYFADAGALPDEFSLLSTAAIDAIIGTDLLNRFDMILDFADHRLVLISR